MVAYARDGADDVAIFTVNDAMDDSMRIDVDVDIDGPATCTSSPVRRR